MLYRETGGEGDDLVVFLHGLGATGAVWLPMLADVAADGPKRWTILDLPGHGGSDPLPHYTTGHLAAAVAEVLADIPVRGRVTVVGHSLGGVVALALASGWFGIEPTEVFCIGVKCRWPDDELARWNAVAARPARLFETKAEASAFHLRVSGLVGIDVVDRDLSSRGTVRRDDGWRLAMDPRANGIGRPQLARLMAAAACPARLACADDDPIVRLDELRHLDLAAKGLGPGGHSIIASAPGMVRDWIRRSR